ncbi:MAG TPA: hypothetical protein ENO22_13950 [candidate division Zixibacteria bacterium]|nr:hypothetical protein [candidate division Zixibacteria bacterium]
MIISFLLLPPAFSQTNSWQEVRYSLSPVVTGIAWNSDLNLKNGLLYGGKLGIDFGALIGLEAFYVTSGNLWTEFSETGLLDTAGLAVSDQRVKVRRYGGDLIIKLPSGRFAPFVKAGGGVIRFEPESGENVEEIDVRIGAGLDFIFSSRLRTRAWVEMNRFRLDRYSLAPGGVTSGQYPADPDADKIRNNFSIGLSLDYAIGQSRFGAPKSDEKLRPFSALELEPLLGRLDFDDSQLGIVTVGGARIGGELNPWVGWGLYYWHALESDLSDTRPLQSYGGEARFSLASKTGPQPHVIIGVGQLDFRSGFIDSDSLGPDDRTAFILGAGVRAEVFRGMQLNISVRDLMYDKQHLEEVSGVDEISHNWLFSGGLVFGIGGRGRAEKPKAPEVMPAEYSTPRVEAQEDTAALLAPEQEPVDTTVEKSQDVTDVSQRGYISDEKIVIPVPLEGEIYIRYGEPSHDVEKTVKEILVPQPEIQVDSSGPEIVAPEAEPSDTTSVPAAPVPPDTALSAPAVPRTEQAPPPVSRSELDSLMNALRSDISAMLEEQASRQDTMTTDTAVADDSVVTALKRELEASEQERRRLDSLLSVQAHAVEPAPDTVSEQRIQKAIAEQVAAELAARQGETEKDITQDDLQNMMAELTARMDSITSQRAALDSARLRDQLQLEIVRQTKSQEEFQQAMEEFMERYDERQEDREAETPTVILTQPAPSTHVIESETPSIITVKPDTQYVAVSDTVEEKPTAPVSGLDVREASEKNNFVDLRPTAYFGFGLERPKQFVLGGRLDFGPITSREERLRLVPEFALGLGGGGVSVMAVMNAQYDITDIEAGDYILVPYARMGLGVLGLSKDISDKGTDAVFNLTYGVRIDFGETGLLRGIGSPGMFIEHQIIDLFDFNRLVLGLQWLP